MLYLIMNSECHAWDDDEDCSSVVYNSAKLSCISECHLVPFYCGIQRQIASNSKVSPTDSTRKSLDFDGLA